MRWTISVVAGALIASCAGVTCAQTLTADDAGADAAGAAPLHPGTNTGRFDYHLPRSVDVDCWSFATQPGRLYRVRAYPIDGVAESIAMLAQTDADWYITDAASGLRAMGLSGEDRWVRGGEENCTAWVTVRGLAARDGTPVRYAIDLEETPDPGDPEGDTLAQAVPLTVGDWHDGALSPGRCWHDASSTTTTASDVDAFIFPFEDRTLYRIEVTWADGLDRSMSLTRKGVATSQSRYAALTGVPQPANNTEVLEARGSGTAWFTLQVANQDDAASMDYRVRVVRLGTAPPDDHGDTPQTATPLTPGPGLIRAELDQPSAAPASTVRIADPDWFAVSTVAGHSYEVLVERGGVITTNSTVTDVVAEDPAVHRADAQLNIHQTTGTNLLASIRFRGRSGEPVRFGLIGRGRTTLRVIDQGPVTDDRGDPLTGMGVISLASGLITGRLENPRDIDSFAVETPQTPGWYRIDYTVTPAGQDPGFAPGYALTRGVNRDGQFHISNGGINLRRDPGSTLDSFAAPVRLDMLSKPWPSATYPLIGTTVTYTLRMVYVGPITPTTNPTPADDAPSGGSDVQVLPPGVTAYFQWQGGADTADAVGLQLVAGHLYRIGGRFTGGEVFDPDGRPVATEIYNNDGLRRQFVARTSGVYMQVQRYGEYISANGYTYSLAAGATDAGEVVPEPDPEPHRLRPGVTAGLFDHPGDRDTYLLDGDPGDFYRVTLNSTVPAWMLDFEYDYVLPSTDLTAVQGVFLLGGPAPSPAQHLVVGAAAGNASPYQLTVEKVWQSRADNDPPDALGVRMPLQAGGSAVIVRDHGVDHDVVEFAVRAGHQYRLRFVPLLTPDQPLDFPWPVLDEAGRTVATMRTLDPIFAPADAVWHVTFENPWAQPVEMTVLDDGTIHDDYGTGEVNQGHLTLGETRTGVLERAEDVDLFHVDDLLQHAADAIRITYTNLDDGSEMHVDYERGAWAPHPVVGTGGLFGPGPFPMHYAVRAEVIPPLPGPPQPCAADLGRTGGALGADGVLDNNDLIAFVNFFFLANSRADVGTTGGLRGSDGWLDANDFVAFIDLFFAGCP